MSVKSSTLQKTFSFSLRYTGLDDLTEAMVDAFFEAGCDDATLGFQEGLIFLDFHREAPSFKDALLSAIEDVERSAVPIRLVRVEPI